MKENNIKLDILIDDQVYSLGDICDIDLQVDNDFKISQDISQKVPKMLPNMSGGNVVVSLSGYSDGDKAISLLQQAALNNDNLYCSIYNGGCAVKACFVVSSFKLSLNSEQIYVYKVRLISNGIANHKY